MFTFVPLRRAHYFSPQAQGVYAIFCCSFFTSAANDNRDAHNAQNARFGSGRTFVNRHDSFNIFLCVAFVRALLFYTGVAGYVVFRRARLVRFVTFLHRRGKQQRRGTALL